MQDSVISATPATLCEVVSRLDEAARNIPTRKIWSRYPIEVPSLHSPLATTRRGVFYTDQTSIARLPATVLSSQRPAIVSVIVAGSVK